MDRAASAGHNIVLSPISLAQIIYLVEESLAAYDLKTALVISVLLPGI
jgi:hypothetical protein